ncbi:sigma-70 family RNA polymerase sigma factor [Kribbella sp. NBC_00382]|uniref:RNA polymerase sigma factor n=1 Tax=Kribbella sp. NBC_00382 TaxID=2975967 RepID=UPI002E237D16
MRDDPDVIRMVVGARDGDSGAWDELVERYAPLVWSICRRYGLSAADVDDVGQSVWLQLVEHLTDLREPAALPGWIATATQRNCLRLVRLSKRTEPADPVELFAAMPSDLVPVDQELLRHERHAAVQAAFGQLSPRCRLLLSMLVQDPPAAYLEISEKLHMPVGSIGPNRARCLDRLRQAPALAALIESCNERPRASDGGEWHGRPMVDR